MVNVGSSGQATAPQSELGLRRTKLLGLSQDEIKALVRNIGEQDFRAAQLYKWVYDQRGRDIDSCTVLSKNLRKTMSDAEICVGRDAVVDVVAANDGTTKVGAEGERESVCVSVMGGGALCLQILSCLDDKRVIEAVGIPSYQARKPRLTVCVSSQVVVAAAAALSHVNRWIDR